MEPNAFNFQLTCHLNGLAFMNNLWCDVGILPIGGALQIDLAIVFRFIWQVASETLLLWHNPSISSSDERISVTSMSCSINARVLTWTSEVRSKISSNLTLKLEEQEDSCLTRLAWLKWRVKEGFVGGEEDLIVKGELRSLVRPKRPSVDQFGSTPCPERLSDYLPQSWQERPCRESLSESPMVMCQEMIHRSHLQHHFGLKSWSSSRFRSLINRMVEVRNKQAIIIIN